MMLAVEILNRHRHNGYDYWCERGGVVQGEAYCDAFTAFEAIAIAEKYEREAAAQIADSAIAACIAIDAAWDQYWGAWDALTLQTVAEKAREVARAIEAAKS